MEIVRHLAVAGVVGLTTGFVLATVSHIFKPERKFTEGIMFICTASGFLSYAAWG